jgi:hypothetical protein
MINIKVIRTIFNKTETLGKMYIDNVFFAYTCEDTYRGLKGKCEDKVQNKTCIDNGTYNVALTRSTRFKKILPELINVPCFTAIRIHGGNTSEDTEGCILIGSFTDNKTKIWGCAEKVSQLVTKLTNVKEIQISVEGEPKSIETKVIA